MSGFELPLIAAATSIIGTGISAFGQYEQGQAAQQAGQITAANTLAAAKFASETALAGADMTAKFALQGAELESAGSQRQADVAAQFALGRSTFTSAIKREGAAKAAEALREGGIMSQRAAELSAIVAGRQAGDARAVASQAMLEQRRNTKLTLSTLQARAAASGGSASDETIKRLAGNIGERGEYFALTELYMGESQARGFEDLAAQHRFAGDAARYGAELQRSATLFMGESEARAAEYEGAATAAAARIDANTKSELAKFRAESTAAVAKFEGDSRSKAALMEGQAKAQSALFAGNNAASAANTMALSTIVGGAASAFRGAQNFGGFTGGNSFFPSSSFMNNEWGF